MASTNVSRPRTSRSCGNCRAVKRRCDQQLPSCGQCIRTREECSGYRDEWDLVFRDQTDHTIKRSKEKEAKSTDLAKASNSFPPPRGLSPSVDEIGVNYFLHNFVVGGDSPSLGFLNYIPTIFNSDGGQSTLATSMAAVGLLALANKQPELVARARAKHSEAVRDLNAALASPVESIKDGTLMSVISLGMFEYATSFESWDRHIQGAAALVVARGKSQFSPSNTAAILMFNQVRADMITTCIQKIRPFPDDMRELQTVATKQGADGLTAFWPLGVLATRCATLLWSVTENIGNVEIPWSDFLEEATVLEHDLQSVTRILALEEPFTTTRESDGDSDQIYDGRVDLYKTSWAIRVWNNSRMLQIVVYEIICYLLEKVLASNLTPDAEAHMKLRLQEGLDMLSKLGRDILATVPQAFGFISSASGQDASIDSPADSSVSGGYMLTWSLYTVGKSPVTSSNTRRWIINRLQDIGKRAGLALTLQLVEEIVVIDQLVGRRDRN